MTSIPRLLSAWPTKIALLVTVLVALGLLAERPSAAPSAEAAASPAGPALSSAPIETFAPSGVLTFAFDGALHSLRVDDPATWFQPPEVDALRANRQADPDVFPSPDGRYVVSIRDRRDTAGVILEVRHSSGGVAFQRAIAGGPNPAKGALVRGPKELAAAVDGIPLAVAWSPDSTRVAFGSITDDPWHLGIIQVNSWIAEFHAVSGGYVGELAWSPDGQSLAVSTYEVDRADHTVLVLDPLAHTLQQLIRGCVIVWSPDSRYLAVHREPRDEPGIWLTAVDGGALVRVVEESAAFPIAWTAE